MRASSEEAALGDDHAPHEALSGVSREPKSQGENGGNRHHE
jgi:hypothetical protein